MSNGTLCILACSAAVMWSGCASQSENEEPLADKPDSPRLVVSDFQSCDCRCDYPEEDRFSGQKSVDDSNPIPPRVAAKRIARATLANRGPAGPAANTVERARSSGIAAVLERMEKSPDLAAVFDTDDPVQSKSRQALGSLLSTHTADGPCTSAGLADPIRKGPVLRTATIALGKWRAAPGQVRPGLFSDTRAVDLWKIDRYQIRAHRTCAPGFNPVPASATIARAGGDIVCVRIGHGHGPG